jgi:TonB family protein
MKKLIEIIPRAHETKVTSAQPSSCGLLRYLEETLRNDLETVVVREVLIPVRPFPWSAFAIAVLLQVLTVAVLVTAPLLFPEKFEAVRRYFVMTLARGDELKPKKITLHKAPSLFTDDQETVHAFLNENAEPAPLVPRIFSPIASSPLMKPRAGAQGAEPAPSIPITGIAASYNLPPSLLEPSVPILKRPREGVQAGGFDIGDQSVGGGLGADGGNGKSGVIDAKFSGSAGDFKGRSGGTGRGVRQGMFLDQHANVIARKTNTTVTTNASTMPVKILEKPRPVYTDDARAEKIEGEVLLQVLFLASGEVRVTRVVQSLGHGLDDSAQEAARRIRFEPAQKDGQAVDSAAIVHIVFELAY